MPARQMTMTMTPSAQYFMPASHHTSNSAAAVLLDLGNAQLLFQVLGKWHFKLRIDLSLEIYI
jgi:hypothetical protein